MVSFYFSLIIYLFVNIIFGWLSIAISDIYYPERRNIGYFSLFNRLRINIFRALALGLVYGFLEVHIVVNLPGTAYRLVYILLLAAPFLNTNILYFFADSIFAEFIQDTSYWLFAWKMPFQWAWYYPVLKLGIISLPIDDLIALPIFIILYYLASNKKIQNGFYIRFSKNNS